jgi:hypothetical protein
MKLDRQDIECLKAAKEALGGWRPWRGVYGRAKTLTSFGYLKVAGTTAMPPHVCYVISEQGDLALTIAAAMSPAHQPGEAQ